MSDSADSGLHVGFVNLDLNDSSNAVLDRFFLGLSREAAHSIVFMGHVAEAFGAGVMRGLNDVWTELYHNVRAKDDPCRAAFSRSGGNVICNRVSTAQRGGLWVVGKRTLLGNICLLVISQCPTLNDALEVVDKVLKDSAATL